ncbi:MAG: hypothetical protein EP330_31270 [Deltaproteobacteria bacterium]|nr:MAG: hypothetical protein EP330_31270 [Deltaproteobacteria bacterium]
MPNSAKPLHAVPIAPPPTPLRARRQARFAAEGERKNRYSLPERLDSHSPVGFRHRIPLTAKETNQVLPLLALDRPTGFGAPGPITDNELFEETSLGVLTARQSTNFRGHRQVSFDGADAERVTALLKQLAHLEAPVLDGATAVHLTFARPYRTPFTALLTIIGHRPVRSLLSVPKRLYDKRRHFHDDIPTIGFLKELHIGILADAMERAALIASRGTRRAQVLSAPFSDRERRQENKAILDELYALSGIGRRDRLAGWHLVLATQVGTALESEAMSLPDALWEKVGANLMSLRSERIQPGVNHEPSAPAPYQMRQDMRVPDELTVMCGRAAYNAFAHWTGVERERAKDLLLLERVDVLHPGGKRRIRQIRGELGAISDDVIKNLPLWVDLPTGGFFSKNAARGRKAFALAGQRIYICGLSRPEIDAEGLNWDQCVRAVGAAASRSALYAELMGVTDLPEDCDLLAGICLMAGPVNQNDIGKQFYGYRDLLAEQFPDRDPTSLLVWTLKAKTVADPIGNEEQLLNAARKGALVDLRAGPHDVVAIARGGQVTPFREAGSNERAFAAVGNFVTDPEGRDIPGNRGEAWPEAESIVLGPGAS